MKEESGVDLNLRNKTAIVTGASQGIGKEIARLLYAEGVHVVMVSQHSDTLEQAARAITGQNPQASQRKAPAVHPIAADLTLRAEVERICQQAIERLGHVDILVNNAARARTGSFFQMQETDLQEVWQVKALGYVRMVRAIAPHMMERGSGSIINVVGSTARTPTEDFIVGSMVNAALVSFTRGISRELARKGVRINSISPGWTLTERQERSFEMQAAAQSVPVSQIVSQHARGIPLKRLVTTQEVASMAVLLASDQFPALTGEDIMVDGGATPSI